MLDDLRVKNPAIRAFNSSLISSDQSALYRREFKDQQAKMRLLWSVQVLGWLAILFYWIAWIAHKAYAINQ